MLFNQTFYSNSDCINLLKESRFEDLDRFREEIMQHNVWSNILLHGTLSLSPDSPLLSAGEQLMLTNTEFD